MAAQPWSALFGIPVSPECHTLAVHAHSAALSPGAVPGRNSWRSSWPVKGDLSGQFRDTGGGRLAVVGDVDSLFATYLKKLVRDGTLRLA